MMYKNITKALALTLFITLPSAQATVVEFQTSQGNFKVNLFDSTTPKTVENFLGYVNSGVYFNSVMHRSVPDFIVQGGGFNYAEANKLDEITSGDPVTNEPKLSNLRGTIAMAKKGGDENSATNQWFFNLVDNSANLDLQNGGFTVFGVVLDNGMDVVDSIADLPRYNLGGALAEIPLRNYTSEDSNNGTDVTDQHFVIINDIVVTDTAVDTHPEIVPVENTLINQDNSGGNTGGTIPSNSGGGGGGSFGFLSLLVAAGLFIRRKF